MPIVRGELLKRKRGAVVGRRELKEKMRAATPKASSSSSGSSSHDTTAPSNSNHRHVGIAAKEIAFLQHATRTKGPRNRTHRKYEQAQKKARKQGAVSETEASRDFYDSGDFDAVAGDVAASVEEWWIDDMVDLSLTDPEYVMSLSWDIRSKRDEEWLRLLRVILLDIILEIVTRVVQ